MSEESSENALLSEDFNAMKDALEILYVISNISGRIQFAQNWPAAARYVLGERLIQFDQEGAPDKKVRMDLELDAQSRRVQLLDFLENVEDKSVDKGALQVEFVEDAVKKLGRELALNVYSEKIVNRFIPAPSPPPIPAESSEAQDTLDAQGAETPSSIREEPLVPPEPPNVISPADLGKPDVAVNPVADMQAPKPQAPVDIDPMDNIKPIDMSPKPAVVEPVENKPPAPPPTMDAPVEPMPPQPPAAPTTKIHPPVEASSEPAQPVSPVKPKSVKGDVSSIKFVSSKKQKSDQSPPEGSA